MFNRNDKRSVKFVAFRPGHPRPTRRSAEQAGVRTAVLLLICFVLGVGVGAYWLHRSGRPVGTADTDASATASELSPSTKAVLSRLDAPVEIRYYTLLDSGEDSLRAFAARVEQLLSRFKQAADGKLTVTRIDDWSKANTERASADGVVPFNLEKGVPSYLGLSLTCKARKETISQITPEWESSVEADLARAIARLLAPTPVTRSPADAAQAAAAEEALRRTIPSPAAVSFEEGRKLLQEAAIREVEAAVKEMERELDAIRQRILNAESSNAQSEREAAVKELQAAQAKHMEKLRTIASRSNEQIEALKRLKGQ